eukprot:jgi/Hompol1/1991/HPOL_002112-RA
MVLLHSTAAMREALQIAAQLPCLQDDSLQAELKSSLDKQSIEHRFLKRASSELLKTYPDRLEYSFSRLSAEYLRIMDEVRAVLANKEYEEMVMNVARSSSHSATTGLAADMRELRNVSRQILSIFNVLVSMAAVFVAIYVASERLWSEAPFVSCNGPIMPYTCA